MSANLNINLITGLHSFASVKQSAWHGKGQILTDYVDSQQMQIESGLNFTVAKGLNERTFPNGKHEISADSYFTYRTDTYITLGEHVTADYEIFQNADGFAFCDSIVKGSGIKYETAGCLGKGETVFITALAPQIIRVGYCDDVIEMYLLITFSHNGTKGVTVALTPVRVVCQNTLNAALKNTVMSVTFRHTRNLHERLKDVNEVFGLVEQQTDNLTQTFNQWAKVRIQDSEVKKLVSLALATNKETLTLLELGDFENTSTQFQNTVDKVLEYSMSADSQQLETTKGTVFGAYNGLTGYYQNVCEFKNSDSKMKATLFGGLAQQRVQKAFNLCEDYTKFGSEIFKFN